MPGSERDRDAWHPYEWARWARRPFGLIRSIAPSVSAKGVVLHLGSHLQGAVLLQSHVRKRGGCHGNAWLSEWGGGWVPMLRGCRAVAGTPSRLSCRCRAVAVAASSLPCRCCCLPAAIVPSQLLFARQQRGASEFPFACAPCAGLWLVGSYSAGAPVMASAASQAAMGHQ